MSSYRGRSKGSYGTQKHGKSSFHGFGKGKRDADILAAQRNFESRSKRSQGQDMHRFATIAPNIIAYLKDPTEWDWKGVDDPNVLVKINAVTKLAKKRPVHMIIEDGKAKKTHHFKIVKKSEAEKLKAKAEDANAKDRENYKRDLDRQFREGKLSKEAYEKARLNAEAPKELTKAEVNDPIIESSHKLPSAKEILERAQELYQKENFKAVHEENMPEALPSKIELAEEGYLQKAKLDLMTSEDTTASRKVMDYVDSLRGELEKIGFDIVPIAGFEL